MPVASQSDWDSESELLSASKNDEIASVQQANAVSNDVTCCCLLVFPYALSTGNNLSGL